MRTLLARCSTRCADRLRAGVEDVRLSSTRDCRAGPPAMWGRPATWYRSRSALPVERARRRPFTGDARPQLARPQPRVDFFAAKAVLEALMRALRVDWRVEAGADEPFLHPRRGASVFAGDAPAGWLGELHPSVAAAWDLDGAAGFELDFGALAAAATACRATRT